jgi:hypothetical protein
MNSVSLEAVLAEYRNHVDQTTYQLMLTKAALADVQRQLAEKDSEIASLKAAHE